MSIREPSGGGVRLRAMPSARPPRSASALTAALLVALVAAACVDATVGPATPPVDVGAPRPSAPPPSLDPGGGGTGGNPGSGAPIVGEPVGPTPVDPGANQPALQVPKPGQHDPHPVAVQSLQASIDGRHVLVKITWYGGIAPCSVLDSVKVDRGEGTVALTVIEGSSDLDAVCAEIAMLKATIVDLGELAPGSWTINPPNGDAAPIDLTIS
jgi:hypothetical protein